MTPTSSWSPATSASCRASYLKGDVAYNTDDIGACEGGATECPATTTDDVGNNQDDTIGGVVSVQFNY